MSKEKHHRHDQEQEHHSMAASTDVADLADADSSQAASKHQRKGEAVDERFGAGAAHDAHGRILKTSVVGDQVEIYIGLGHAQGIVPGMMGYVQAGGNMLSEFQIHQVDERYAVALVDAPLRAVQDASGVVVNPSSLPGPAHDVHGRVLMNTVEGDRFKVMIGLGAAQGIRNGMKGYLTDDSGRPYVSFTISAVEGRVSHAYVPVHNLDEIHAHSLVVLNSTVDAQHPNAAAAAPAVATTHHTAAVATP